MSIQGKLAKDGISTLRVLGKTRSAALAGTSADILVLLEDNVGKILLAVGTDVPAGATNGYAKGCLFIDRDVVTGTTGLYENKGTSTSCDFATIASAGATVWSAIGDATEAGSVSFSTYAQVLTSAKTDGDMLTIKGTGNFGDVSILKVMNETGNPTDGTILEVVSSDANADALVVTANSTNCLTVSGAGVVDVNGGAGSITFTDFTVSADGVITVTPDDSPAGCIVVTPSAAATTGLDVSDANLTNAISVGDNVILGGAASINFTSFDVASNGNIVTTGNVTAVDGTFSGNLAVTGAVTMDAVVAKTAATTLTVDGTGVGGVTIGGTSTGTVTLGGGATLVNLPSTVDLVLAGGDLTITDTANADMVTFTNNTMTTADLLVLSATGTRTSDNVIEITDGATSATTIGIVANTQTSGHGISYSNSGAALSGAAINLAITDGAGFTGDYIRCYDGAAEDFTVERYGEVTIAGVASTDMLTVVAGDIQLTAGDIDIDRGFITIDNDQDEANYIKRNFAGAGTGATLTVQETHASSTNSALNVVSAGTAGTALKIDQTGTGNAIGIDLNIAGDYPGIDIDASAARTGDVIDILMTNQLAERALNINGAWTGATGEGLIEVNTTAAATVVAGQVLRLDQNGTGQHAAAIEGSVIYVADAATAPGAGTSYAVTIDATNIEALHVDTGKALFDEQPTFTAGIDSNAGLDVDLATNADLVNIDNAATDLAAGVGVVTVYGSGAAGQTNASYLMRLAWKADGDAQDHFLLCQDNSTGAAANGDEKFSVSTGGLTKCLGGVSPGSATDSILMTDTVEITNSQIKGLRAAAKELVAAPGADKMVEFVSAVLILDYGSEVLTESVDNLVIQYSTGADLSAAIEATGFIDAAADTICVVKGIDVVGTAAAAGVVNKSIVLFNTGDGEYGGNASNDTTMTVKVTYRIHTVGLA